MISIDELNATIKRQQLIVDNCSDDTDRYVASCIINTLKQLAASANIMLKSPELPKVIEKWKAEYGKEKV